MHQLSQELISRIASFVEREEDQSQVPLAYRVRNASKLPPYAAISKTWQYAIERLTFRKICLKSTELLYFSKILVGHRRACLAILQYEIVLPTYDDSRCAKFEDDNDKLHNNRVFTDAIHGLLRILNSWEGASARGLTPAYAIALNLYAPFSPMDGIHRGEEKYKNDKWQSDIGQRHDLWHHRYERSILRLLSSHDLPTVSSVWQFNGHLHYPRSIEPCAVAVIAAKLVKLRSVDLSLKDNEKRDRWLQLNDRDEFAKALSMLSQSSIEVFHLNFYNESPSNQNFRPREALVSFSSYHDDLSPALHSFTQSPSIREVMLEGPIVISPSLFWPSNPRPAPFWQNITNFHITFNLNTPDGNWYFVRDPDMIEEEDEEREGSDEEEPTDSEPNSDSGSVLSDDSLVPDTYNEKEEARVAGNLPVRYFRTLPDSEKIIPLLTAMARAAGQMPKLQRTSLKADLICNLGNAYFEIEYLAPGQTSWNIPDENDDDEEKRRLYWQTGKWRPDGEVLRLWREAKGQDGDLLVRFVEW